MVNDPKSEILYIISPCYNEAECLKASNACLNKKLEELIKQNKVSNKSRILYVNDGSTDSTFEIVKEISEQNERVKYISFSRNFGQQSALIAGMENAVKYADIIITIDVDLQDDINVINTFIEEYKKGNEIVFGVRDSRKTDSYFKRNTALSFYKIMNKLGTGIVYNHSEYRLMSKKAVKALLSYPETNIFLRGMVKNLGFKHSIVKYDRSKRESGKSKYSFTKMFELAKEGILSFSTTPLKLITRLGIVIFILSVVYCVYVLIGYVLGINEPGWTTIVGLICLFGGLQILCIGIIGEYIAKMYGETKRRPRYIIEQSNIDEKREDI